MSGIADSGGNVSDHRYNSWGCCASSAWRKGCVLGCPFFSRMLEKQISVQSQLSLLVKEAAHCMGTGNGSGLQLLSSASSTLPYFIHCIVLSTSACFIHCSVFSTALYFIHCIFLSTTACFIHCIVLSTSACFIHSCVVSTSPCFMHCIVLSTLPCFIHCIVLSTSPCFIHCIHYLSLHVLYTVFFIYPSLFYTLYCFIHASMFYTLYCLIYPSMFYTL